MTPDQYCQKIAAGSKSSFYQSFLFLPIAKRQAITALYAFCREVDDIVDETKDSSQANLQLDAWREEIARLFKGNPIHPIARALATSIQKFNLAEEYFQEIIDGMAMDLAHSHYGNFSELSLYCYRVASAVGLLAIEIFGYQNKQTRVYANDLGMAFQLTNILRDVAEDTSRGRIYIPVDELETFGVKPQSLTGSQTTPALRNLFEFQAQRAQKYYQTAFENLPAVDRKNQRSGLIMAAIYQRILAKIAADDYRILENRHRLPTWQKLWLAWQVVRQERE